MAISRSFLICGKTIGVDQWRTTRVNFVEMSTLVQLALFQAIQQFDMSCENIFAYRQYDC